MRIIIETGKKKKKKQDKAVKKKREFSKTLLIQESFLIWIETLAFLGLAYFCIIKGYTGSIPWLTSFSALPWTAYAVSQGFYYNKSKKENTQGGIIYETALAQLDDNTIDTTPQSTIDTNYGI